MHFLAAIPSPGDNAIHLGPLQLRAYGLMIALGVLAAVWLASKRFVEFEVGTPEDVQAIAFAGVPAGIVGARIYHVITDWELFRDDPMRAFKIWQGGLGIPGGIALGMLVGWWVARRRHLSIPLTLDAVAPAIPLAQAIGRLGNWWNQELFGGPSTKPWAVKIDLVHRPAGYEQFSTFQPTFLYELLWNVALCGALIWLGKRWTRIRPGRLIWAYVAGYSFARFFIERIRIDKANKILGLRINEWTSLIMFVVALGFIAASSLRSRRPAYDQPSCPTESLPPTSPTSPSSPDSN
ncbi:MAG: lgt [Acidimicrobiia bacterium]|nr:lgt [Acidimicrobiia bacterium]